MRRLLACGLTVLALQFLACATTSPGRLAESCSVVGTPTSPKGVDRPTADIPASVVPDSIERVGTDTPPRPIGGMRSFLMGADYPDAAYEDGEEGVVHVSFVVDREGRPRNLAVARGVNRHLDRAALDAVLEHRFEPGRADGRPICVPMTLPMTFRLQ